ncbi:hypothetical protein [Luteimonas chenhongjianii]|uniref:hypothetical protein n=1 Tax=Luteimonas chenhongjianii TaxID=2006110 RepID=UPI0012FDB2E3|nr:hypothetical protein [Luteimonas chenhongjianii]
MNFTKMHIWIPALIAVIFLGWGVSVNRPSAVFFSVAMFFGIAVVMLRGDKKN